MGIEVGKGQPGRSISLEWTECEGKTLHKSKTLDRALRSTIGIAAVQTAIEYEYRYTEYEYDEIRWNARTRLIALGCCGL